MKKAAVVIGFLAFVWGVAVSNLFADPLLSKPEIVGGRILIFPDHKAANVYYYVPAGLALVRSFNQPQFFFYKYVYVKSDTSEGPQTIAGGRSDVGRRVCGRNRSAS